MVNIPAPPKPPETTLNNQEQLATFKQMLASLEETADYQEKVIAYHTQSLELLQAEIANTKAKLQSCREIINTLTNTQKLILTVTPQQEKASSNGSNSVKVDNSKHESVAKVKTEKSIKAKTNSKSTTTKDKSDKSRSAKKTNIKAISQPKATSSKTTKKSNKKLQPKILSTLPSSDLLDKFESITALVLDFVQKQEGVIAVSDVIKYVYPDGLNEAQYKRASSSFSSVLGNQTKKKVLERTVPGKYRWLNK